MSTPVGDTTRHTIIIGVPQGGGLSTVLFSVTLIDLAKHMPKNVRISLYPDDICVWTSSFSQRYVFARLQKALFPIQICLDDSGLAVSAAKCGAVAFTRRYVHQYPIVLQGTVISYKPHHTFLGVPLDRTLSWNPRMKQVKNTLLTIINILRFVSGTRWGPTVSSLMQLYNALFVGYLRYSLPARHGLYRTNLRILESLQAQALRVCLGLPAGTSNVGTVVEAGAVLPGIMRCRGTIRANLYVTKHDTSVTISRSSVLVNRRRGARSS